MNEDLLKLIEDDVKELNKEYSGKPPKMVEKEQDLVHRRLEELFPDFNLKVIPNASGYFSWYQPELGIDIAVNHKFIDDEGRTHVGIHGRAYGASRTVEITRPADVVACRGFSDAAYRMREKIK